MSPTARFIAAVAAVAVVATVGLGLAFRPGGVAAPSSPSPSGSPSPSPVALLAGAASGTDLPPGAYFVDRPFPVHVTFTVPTGWTPYTVDERTAGILVNHGKPENGSGWGLFFLAGSHFHSDPCRPENGTIATPSAAAIVSALTNLPTVSASTPSATTVGGRPATLVTLTAPATLPGCPDGTASIWETVDGSGYGMAPGEQLPLRIVDVDGVAIVVMATDFPQSSSWEDGQTGATPNPTAHATDQIELRRIVDSIRLEPVAAEPSAATPSGS